jgi:hypothetical protein
MGKLIRVTSNIFAGALTSGSDQVEQFASKTQTGTPNYSVDPAVIQSGGGGAWWADGWGQALDATNNSEYKQDRNAVDLVLSYQISYLLQQGIPEWDSATTYYTNSIVQSGGSLYQSLVDSNTGNTPPTDSSNSAWKIFNQPMTRTVLITGSGTYTPPAGCIRINVSLVGGGGGGGGTSAGGNGTNTSFGAFVGYGGQGGSYSGGPIGGLGGNATGGSVNIPGASGSAIGSGGSSFFGGAGAPNPSLGGANAAGNSGSGGGGSYVADTACGGAGGYVEGTIINPTSTAYSVGIGGAAGVTTAGTGGSGVIIIDEYYS